MFRLAFPTHQYGISIVFLHQWWYQNGNGNPRQKWGWMDHSTSSAAKRSLTAAPMHNALMERLRHLVEPEVYAHSPRILGNYPFSRGHKNKIEDDVTRAMVKDLDRAGRSDLNEADRAKIQERLRRYADEDMGTQPQNRDGPPPHPPQPPAPPMASASAQPVEDGELPVAAPSAEAAAADTIDWRTALETLLQRVLPPERAAGKVPCPFTRQGLAQLYNADKFHFGGTYYPVLAQEFNLPPDPNSPHTLQGGHAWCTGKVADAFTRATLCQHCSKKTEAIAQMAPDEREDGDEASRLHFVLRLVLEHGHARFFDSVQAVAKRPKLEAKAFDEKIAWPPMLFLSGLTPLADPPGLNESTMSDKDKARLLAPSSTARLIER